jgi:uncharacterized protein YdaL
MKNIRLRLYLGPDFGSDQFSGVSNKTTSQKIDTLINSQTTKQSINPLKNETYKIDCHQMQHQMYNPPL